MAFTKVTGNQKSSGVLQQINDNFTNTNLELNKINDRMDEVQINSGFNIGNILYSSQPITDQNWRICSGSIIPSEGYDKLINEIIDQPLYKRLNNRFYINQDQYLYFGSKGAIYIESKYIGTNKYKLSLICYSNMLENSKKQVIVLQDNLAYDQGGGHPGFHHFRYRNKIYLICRNLLYEININENPFNVTLKKISLIGLPSSDTFFLNVLNDYLYFGSTNRTIYKFDFQGVLKESQDLPYPNNQAIKVFNDKDHGVCIHPYKASNNLAYSLTEKKELSCNFFPIINVIDNTIITVKFEKIQNPLSSDKKVEQLTFPFSPPSYDTIKWNSYQGSNTYIKYESMGIVVDLFDGFNDNCKLYFDNYAVIANFKTMRTSHKINILQQASNIYVDKNFSYFYKSQNCYGFGYFLPDIIISDINSTQRIVPYIKVSNQTTGKIPDDRPINNLTFVDQSTSKNYDLYVSNGKINKEEIKQTPINMESEKNEYQGG